MSTNPSVTSKIIAAFENYKSSGGVRSLDSFRLEGRTIAGPGKSFLQPEYDAIIGATAKLAGGTVTFETPKVKRSPAAIKRALEASQPPGRLKEQLEASVAKGSGFSRAQLAIRQQLEKDHPEAA